MFQTIKFIKHIDYKYTLTSWTLLYASMTLLIGIFFNHQLIHVRYNILFLCILIHGPEVVFWGEVDIFADKGFPWFFDQIYLVIEEKSGELYFRLRFWTPEPFKVKLSFTFTSSLKICIRSWCWLNIIELDIFLYQMKALFL